MVGPRQHGLAARRLDGVDDGGVAARHQHRADGGLDRAPPDMHDHGLAVDVGQRLVGQAGRGQAGGDDDDRLARRSGSQDELQRACGILPRDRQIHHEGTKDAKALQIEAIPLPRASSRDKGFDCFASFVARGASRCRQIPPTHWTGGMSAVTFRAHSNQSESIGAKG